MTGPTMSALVDTYLTVSGAQQPGFALAWSEFDGGPVPIDVAGLTATYTRIAADLDELRPGGHEAAMLEWCLADRLYDLVDAECWRDDPKFWVDRHCYGILAQLDAGAQLRHMPVPGDWTAGFLANLDPVMTAAIDRMERTELSRYAVRRALRHLDLSRHLVVRVAAVADRPDAVAGAVAAIDRMAAWLTPAADNPTSIRPLGAAVWAAGIRARTGVDVCVDTFEDRLRAVIAAGNDEPVPETGTVPRTRTEVLALLDRVRETYPGPAGGSAAVAEPRFEITEDGPPGVTSAGYQSALSRGGGEPTVFVLPAVYAHRADMELDLVHEVTPGHHWQGAIYQAAHGAHPLCHRHPNLAFLEGWARWCEQGYAGVAGDLAVTARMRARLAKNAVQALASLLVHARGLALPAAATQLGALGWGTAAAVASLVVGAYFEPWQATSPIVGYLALCDIAQQDGAEYLDTMVARNGSVHLIGGKLKDAGARIPPDGPGLRPDQHAARSVG